jgi:hypothetical protein
MTTEQLSEITTRIPELLLVANSDSVETAEITLAIQLSGESVGHVTIALEETEEIDAPAITMQLDSTPANEQAILTASLAAVLKHLYLHTSYPSIHIRHLVGDTSNATLYARAGFKRQGSPYTSDDESVYQNMSLAND